MTDHITSTERRFDRAGALVRLTFALGACVAAGVSGGLSEARAESVGRLLFSDPNTGRNIIGGIDQNGKFHQLAGGTQTSLIGETRMVSTPSGIFAYRMSGAANVIDLDGRGLPRFGGTMALSANWTSIVGLGNYLLFYDGVKTAALVGLNPDGSTLQTDSTTSFSGWSNIVATDNYWFFYQASTGTIATLVPSNIGKFAQTSNGQIATNYTTLATIDDHVMGYAADTGRYAIYAVQYDGNLHDSVQTCSGGTMASGNRVAVKSNGFLLWYNPTYGVISVGYIDSVPSSSNPYCGVWRNTQVTGIERGWTHVFAAGRYVAFFNSSTQALKVGVISPKGIFTQTDFQTVGANYPAATYSAVASTTR